MILVYKNIDVDHRYDMRCNKGILSIYQDRLDHFPCPLVNNTHNYGTSAFLQAKDGDFP